MADTTNAPERPPTESNGDSGASGITGALTATGEPPWIRSSEYIRDLGHPGPVRRQRLSFRS